MRGGKKRPKLDYDQFDEKDPKKTFFKRTSMVHDEFKANIFDANFINTHFTHYHDEI